MAEKLIIILVALVLDRFVPVPANFKRFSWYRIWVESIEQRFNGGDRTHGIGAVMLVLVPILLGIVLVRYVLGEIGLALRWGFDVLVLYLCLDLARLEKGAHAVTEALSNGDLQEAGECVHGLTEKQSEETTEDGIARLTVEAVLKQGSSVVVSPVFWFILLGPFGAVLQRLSSILDALWGHRDERFAEFGWAAARFDDILEWIPARITAMSYAMMGSFEDALRCWRRQIGVWSDINSGPLLASGFGAMHMEVCDDDTGAGNASENTSHPIIVANSGDIPRVVALVWRVVLFWIGIGLLMFIAHLSVVLFD